MKHLIQKDPLDILEKEELLHSAVMDERSEIRPERMTAQIETWLEKRMGFNLLKFNTIISLPMGRWQRQL